ncbi:MAG: bifunctional adenosylcobinamide kinase/adenosylcobinamide-phosphate guanylyltransferase [Chloroflexi bacterium]|nr:bifunctional adenosylcobinamide kinase/adenosylcobinamide-phosphate guanylyltransferase [Chloroflexota bacterium]
MTKQLILVLGGARSGKSAFAQRLASAEGGPTSRVLFIATAEARDPEMAARIRCHRDARPESWTTIEEPFDLASVVGGVNDHDVVLVDCLGLWVSNLLLRDGERMSEVDLESAVLRATQELLDCYQKGRATLIVVTNEVGMGLVPPYPLGRQFQDILGRVNQLVASRADRAYLAIAGLALELKTLASKLRNKDDPP